MTVASRQFCPLQDIHDAVAKRIAELTKNEAALVSADAASAVAIGTAACVASGDREKIQRLPDTRGMKNEVIIQKSHRNGYDHAARTAGIRMIEVESAAELESAIHSRTAMMFFMHMYKNAGQIPFEEFVRIGKKPQCADLDRRRRLLAAGGASLELYRRGLDPGGFLRRQGHCRTAVRGHPCGT